MILRTCVKSACVCENENYTHYKLIMYIKGTVKRGRMVINEGNLSYQTIFSQLIIHENIMLNNLFLFEGDRTHYF